MAPPAARQRYNANKQENAVARKPPKKLFANAGGVAKKENKKLRWAKTTTTGSIGLMFKRSLHIIVHQRRPRMTRLPQISLMWYHLSIRPSRHLLVLVCVPRFGLTYPIATRLTITGNLWITLSMVMAYKHGNTVHSLHYVHTPTCSYKAFPAGFIRKFFIRALC